MARPNLLGSHDPQRVDTQRRDAARERGAILALTTLVAALSLGAPPSAQAEDSAWTGRFEAIEARLEASTSTDERLAARDELVELFDELQGLLPATDASDAYYRTAYLLGQGEAYWGTTWSSLADERLNYLDAARRIAPLLDPRKRESRESRAIYQTGGLLNLAGRATDALPLLDHALGCLPSARRMLPFVRLTEAKSFLQLGRHADALRSLAAIDEELGRLAPHASYEAVEREAWNVRAQALLGLGRNDDASEWVQLARDAIDARVEQGRASAGERALAAMHVLNRALVTEDARRVVEEAPRYLEALDTDADRLLYGSHLLRILAEAQSILERADPERPREAAATFRRVLDRAETPVATRLYAEIGLAEVELRTGEFDRVRALLAGARARFAALNDDGRGTALPREFCKLATISARLELDAGGSVEALRNSRDELLVAFDLLLDQWSELPDFEGGVGFLAKGFRRAVLSELIRVELALAEPGSGEGEAQALRHVLRAQAQGTLAREVGATVPSIDEIRRCLLDETRGLLVYLPASERGHLFALDGRQPAHYELPKRDRIDAVLRAYQRSLDGVDSRPGEEEDADAMLAPERALAAQLAAMLLPDEAAARVRDWSGVTVVGADIFGHIPFEWLPVRGDEPFALTHALDYLPSVPFGVAVAEREVGRAPATDAIFVGGASASDAVLERWPALEALPWSAETERALKRPYGARARTLIGDDAVAARIARAARPGAAVLQFLVHGVFDAGAVYPSHLVLTSSEEDDGLLGQREARAIRGVDLVLLTACRSGQGPLRVGDASAADLSGAWLANGARAVLVSRSDLDYDTTLRLSALFHERLACGLSPAEALRGARVALLEEGTVRLPQATGQLQLVGLGHRPLFVSDALAKPEELDAPAGRGTDPGIPWLTGVAGLLVGLVVGARTRSGA